MFFSTVNNLGDHFFKYFFWIPITHVTPFAIVPKFLTCSILNFPLCVCIISLHLPSNLLTLSVVALSVSISSISSTPTGFFLLCSVSAL